MLQTFTTRTEIPDTDICVVGAGILGIAFAIACEERGLSVLVIESGLDGSEKFSAGLTVGHKVDPERHAEADRAICRSLGGTSHWWGGRCVPYDDVDFAVRPHVLQAAWPIAHEELSRWYPSVARFFKVGAPRFRAPVEPWTNLGDVAFEMLERWAPELNVATLYRGRLAASRSITVLLGATVTQIELTGDGRRVAGLKLANATKQARISPKTVVLACGGLETTRLLLVSQQHRPDAFGGPDGALGRGYMGHTCGKLADLVLADPASVAAHDFFIDDGVYVRRRFTITPEAQARDGLLNIALWADNPPFHDPRHHNGVLSMVWMALAMPVIGSRLASEGIRVAHVGPPPHRWLQHIGNVLRRPFAIVKDLFKVVHGRILARPRTPGFLLRNKRGRYALHYFAEHAPNRDSRVTLGNRRDALGLPYLDIDLQYQVSDVRSVLRAHELVDEALRKKGLGRLEYYTADPEARLASALEQATDGYHQLGATRMSASPKDGVVDPNCRVHGVDNLYIASGSVFASSSQANSTFLAVAVALRLAAHLCQKLTAGGSDTNALHAGPEPQP